MNMVTETLAPWLRTGQIGALDLHFAELMCRLDSQGERELALAAALTCSRTAAGDVCFDLRQVIEAGEVAAALPESRVWEERLQALSVVGAPGEFCPLILDQMGRCYLYRYWHYEQTLADALQERANEAVKLRDKDAITSGLEKYFQNNKVADIDWQKVACATAVMKRLCVISGGPGTGKTTTVVKILALLIEQADGGKPPVIALAAPTGKAAARLQESVQSALSRLPIPAAVATDIPREATTLHRLLGYRPDSTIFRHTRDNPLPVDVLVLDEASMVDLALMSKAIQALPRHARLILLGDKDQLASVEAGAVLGDICGDMPGFSPEFAQILSEITGESTAMLSGDESRKNAKDTGLSDALVALRHSYRFGSEGGIGRLATAVNTGGVEQSSSLLQTDESGELRLIPNRSSLIAQAVAGYRGYLELMDEEIDPEAVLATFECFRVLCALRTGPFGVGHLNQEIALALEHEGLIERIGEWYAGRPIMITRNDYGLRLYNGDIGIVLPDTAGELKVCFRAAEQIRWIAPSRLQHYEEAYCLTVHKSQGSEFDEVCLVLPDQDTPLLSRELLYTAITRARSQFNLLAQEQVLVNMIRRRVDRKSGLRDQLWGT